MEDIEKKLKELEERIAVVEKAIRLAPAERRILEVIGKPMTYDVHIPIVEV